MSVDDNSTSTNPFALSADDTAKLKTIEQALLDPSPRRITVLEQWGLADDYETYAETAQCRKLEIGMADGTVIDALLSVPREVPAGKCPAILMPAPLSPLGYMSYIGTFLRWALGGYVVLAYSQRGLAGSSGEIQVAGPQDVADGKELVTVLSEQEAVDAERIGCFGASYGAGTSLLLAAADPRIKAVAGTSAWADLLTSLYENKTRHLAAFEALVDLFNEERCSAEFKRVIQKIRSNDFDIDDVDDEVVKFAEARSPKNHIQEFNDRQLPILMTTAWHETIFSVPAVIDMFTRLTGPKSLLVQVGDHGNGELPGLFGLVSKPTEMTYRWMDHHLGGHASDGAKPSFGVRSEYMHNLLSDLHHDDWASYTQPKRRFHLAATAADARDGKLIEDAPQPGWTSPLKISVHNTEVVVAPKLVQTGLAERAGRPHVYQTAELDQGLAAIWTTEPLAQPMRVQGELELRVTVTPQALEATIVAYLMDCDPATGEAAIITNAPVTVRSDQPGQATTVTVPLQPAHYVLNKGRQLQLVIDTHDPFFADANRAPSAIELSSPQGAESYVDIPLSTLA